MSTFGAVPHRVLPRRAGPHRAGERSFCSSAAGAGREGCVLSPTLGPGYMSRTIRKFRTDKFDA